MPPIRLTSVQCRIINILGQEGNEYGVAGETIQGAFYGVPNDKITDALRQLDDMGLINHRHSYTLSAIGQRFLDGTDTKDDARTVADNLKLASPA